MSQSAEETRISLGGFFLATLGLAGLAVTAPLFEVAARNSALFAVRGSTPGEIWLLALCAALVPAVALALPVLLVGWIAHRLRPVLTGLAIGLLFAWLALVLARPAGTPAALGVAVLVGGVCTMSYARKAGFRKGLALLWPAPLILLVWFLGFTPVKRLAWPGTLEAPKVELKSKPPIVFIILDELPGFAWLNSDGRPDDIRFPRYAEFLEGATWYPNATTVAEMTISAVPAMLSGVQPKTLALPYAADHPDNLFSLLAPHYEIRAEESATSLCPESECGWKPRPPFMDRFADLVSDLRWIYLHATLPHEAQASLPPLGRHWGDFKGISGEFNWRSYETQKIKDELVQTDPAEFQAYVQGIWKTGRPTLHYFHLMLPHQPWLYLPSLQHYRTRAYPRGYGIQGDTITGPQGAADVLLHRQSIQLAAVDRLLGELFDRLKQQGFYDEALIVIASDHGVSLRTGYDNRRIDRDNAAEIVFTSLAIKFPGQKKSRVVEEPVQTIDVAPTIARALGAELPWEHQGRALQGPLTTLPDSRKVLDEYGDVKTLSYRTLVEWRDKERARQVEALGLFPGADFYRRKPGHTKSGQRMDLDAGVGWWPAWTRGYTIDQRVHLDQIDPSGPFLPASISGEVVPASPGRPLAILFGNEVIGSGHSYPVGDREVYSVAVDPARLVASRGDIRVAEVGVWEVQNQLTHSGAKWSGPGQIEWEGRWKAINRVQTDLRVTEHDVDFHTEIEPSGAWSAESPSEVFLEIDGKFLVGSWAIVFEDTVRYRMVVLTQSLREAKSVTLWALRDGQAWRIDRSLAVRTKEAPPSRTSR